MNSRWSLLIGIVGGLLGAGLIMLVNGQPRGEPVTLLPPPTPAPLMVHITGAVKHPDVYELPVDCRLEDAIQAAGGTLPEADTQLLNLAAYLHDEQQVNIPFQTQDQENSTSNQDLTTAGSDPQAASSLININTASLDDLDRLPGIGPAKGQAIIDYREANGPFNRIEDIQNVSGIGPKIYAQIEDLITVGSMP